MAGDLGVVHLVRRANGLEALDAFLASYRRHPAGMPHELILVLKGFDGDERSIATHRSLAEDLDARWLSVPDDGFDLGSYRRAALQLTHRRLLFLNSFSVILADGWLELLSAAASRPHVGAVAATGSWGSQGSHLRYGLGLGGPYASVFEGRAATQRVFAELAAAPESSATAEKRRRPVRTALEVGTSMLRQASGFASFPSPHLRTNGLLIERETWLGICPRMPRDKLAAHLLESGRRGLTARLRARGLHTLVVGRDGGAERSERWPQTRTFWQGEQENLLIGDNQTRAYQLGDAHRRGVLSGYAWGPSAEPAEPVGGTPA
jgi:hypothetical protein